MLPDRFPALFAAWIVLVTLPASVSRASAASKGSPFGINGAGWSHLGANTDRFDWAQGIRRLDSLQQMGAAWDRCDFWWDRIEPEKGRFVWRDYDRVVDEYHRRGLFLLPILDYDSAWHPNQSPNTDEYRAEYGRYVYETVRHFKGRITAYEVWNEPNISIFWHPEPQVADYVALLKIAYREAKRADPDVTVVGGAVAGMDLSFIEAMLKAGAAGSMDALSVHPYQGNLGSVGPETGNLVADLRRLRALLGRYGAPKMPAWITEMGNRTVPDPSVPKGGSQPTGRVSEQQQANYLVRSYALALSQGVQKIFWFNLQDWPTETWGTITEEFRRKPSWYAYRTMARQLTGARFQRAMTTPSGAHILAFQAKGTTLLGWAERQPVTVGLTGVLGPASFVEPNFDTRFHDEQWVLPAYVWNRRASVALDQEPVYTTGLKSVPSLTDPLARITPPSFRLVPGDRFRFDIRYADPVFGKQFARHIGMVSLVAVDSHKDTEALEQPEVGTWRVSPRIAPGAYSLRYAIEVGNREWRFSAPVTIEPALSIAVAPDPALGRDIILTLVNHSAGPVTATATVDMLGSRTDIVPSAVLAPHQVLTLPLRNVLSADAPLTVPLPVTARATSKAGSAAWSGNIFFWAAGKTWGPPLVLDSAQQWQSQDGTWAGPDDLSAILRARYDERNLYLRAVVTDDVFAQPYAFGEVWRGDSFQIAVDPKWSRRPDTSGSVEFGLALTPSGPQVYRWTAPAGLVRGATLKVTRNGMSTVYEASIPWRQLGEASVHPPMTLGFALILNDNDGKDRQGWLAYGDGIATEKRADRYGTLTLLPGAGG